MVTRLTYTSGARTPELDEDFERAFTAARSAEHEVLPHVVGDARSSDGDEFSRHDPSSTGAVASRAREAPPSSWPRRSVWRARRRANGAACPSRSAARCCGHERRARRRGVPRRGVAARRRQRRARRTDDGPGARIRGPRRHRLTGSAEVGRGLQRLFQDGRYTRPAIVEMGGKNPAIVTAHADLDAAAEGIAASAFGFSGQKCSACSRVLVQESVHDALVERLCARAAAFSVGDPADPDVATGPVVDERAVARFNGASEEARADGIIGAGAEVAALPGHFVAPTVAWGLPPGHRLARDELFLPFVTVTAVSSFDEALLEANATDYGLTAGIFSGDDAEVARFLDQIEAGVVYVNRRAGATTGAWPGIQSFCGWKSSGGTGKGGLGPYYVQQFMREQRGTVVVGD